MVVGTTIAIVGEALFSLRKPASIRQK
jgi:hypothetical protein